MRSDTVVPYVVWGGGGGSGGGGGHRVRAEGALHPGGVVDGLRVGGAAVGAEEDGGGPLPGGRRVLGEVPADRRVHAAGRTARVQAVVGVQGAAAEDGLVLADAAHVVDDGAVDERGHQAGTEAGDVAPARCAAERDGAEHVDGHDGRGGELLLDPPGQTGDGAAGADAHEEVVETGEGAAQFVAGGLVVGVRRIRVGVLVGPVDVGDLLAEFGDPRQPGREVAVGSRVGDLLHPFAAGAQHGLGERVAVGVDDGHEGDPERPAEGGQGGGEVARRRLHDGGAFGDL